MSTHPLTVGTEFYRYVVERDFNGHNPKIELHTSRVKSIGAVWVTCFGHGGTFRLLVKQAEAKPRSPQEAFVNFRAALVCNLEDKRLQLVRAELDLRACDDFSVSLGDLSLAPPPAEGR